MPPRSTTQPLYDPLIGELIEDRYRIQSRLGEGGLATVYSAVHALIDRPVALKVLKPAFVHEKEVVERFVREARAASRLRHPNIVAITDFGRTADGTPFLVMDRVAGPSLADVIAVGALGRDRSLHIAQEVASALEEAHRQDIIHRDVKPDNILLEPLDDGGERAMLVDFGLARCKGESHRLTRAGQVLGSPRYMAPEQAVGEEVDERADIFALGVLLYRMVSGRPPFAGERPLEVLENLMAGPPPSLAEVAPQVAGDTGLVDLVMRSLERDREARPASMAEVRRLLEQLLAPALAEAPAPVPAEGSVRRQPPPEEPPPRRDPTQPVVLMPELAALSEAPVPGAWSRRWVRAFGFVVIAVLALAVGVIAGRLFGPSERRKSTSKPLGVVAGETASTGVPAPAGHPTPAPPAVASRRVPPVVAPRRPASRVKVTFESVPLGAALELDGRPAGRTPLTLSLWGNGRQMLATFRKTGYRTVSRIVRPRPATRVRVWLPKKAVAPMVVGGVRKRPPAKRAGSSKRAGRSRPRLALPELELKDPFTGSGR